MKFTDKYNLFIELCRGKNNSTELLPNNQIDGLENNPILNQPLIPTPRDWFINTFEWYVGI